MSDNSVSKEAVQYANRYYLDHPALDNTRSDLIALFDQAITDARAKEREACALVADDHAIAWGRAMGQQAKEIANAIRKRVL